MDRSNDLTLTAVPGMPLVNSECDVVDLILGALASINLVLQAGDVLVVAQKIVSKSEGRMVRLEEVNPGNQAIKLAEKTAKDPRLIELILSGSIE